MIHRQQLVLRGELGRNQLLRGRNLRDHRLEAGVEQRADVELAALEQLDHLAGDRLRRLELDRANGAQIDHFQDLFFVRASKLVVALLADAQNFHRLALGRQSIGAIARQTHDRGVEGAAEAALAGADDQKMRLIRAGSGEQARSLGAARAGAGEIGEHRLDLVGIGSRRLRGACARLSFDTATICIALVIFCVDLTEAIRFRRSLREGISRLRAPLQAGAG